jgi:hypothetical protein
MDFRGALGVEFRSVERFRDSLHILAASLIEIVCQSFAKRVNNVFDGPAIGDSTVENDGRTPM